MGCCEGHSETPSRTRRGAAGRAGGNSSWRPLRIGQLAELLGTSTKTLRFYESIGLLDKPARTESGYRLYDTPAVSQARLIVGLRRLGLSIEEVGALLGDEQEGSLRQRLTALMSEKLRDIELELGVLQGRRDDLAARLDALLATPRGRPGECLCEAIPAVCICGAAAGGH